MTLPFGNSYRLVTRLTPGATHYRARLKLAFNSVSVSSVSVGAKLYSGCPREEMNQLAAAGVQAVA